MILSVTESTSKIILTDSSYTVHIEIMKFDFNTINRIEFNTANRCNKSQAKWSTFLNCHHISCRIEHHKFIIYESFKKWDDFFSLQIAEKQWISNQNGIAEILVIYRFLHSLFIWPKCEKYCHFNFAWRLQIIQKYFIIK